MAAQQELGSATAPQGRLTLRRAASMAGHSHCASVVVDTLAVAATRYPSGHTTPHRQHVFLVGPPRFQAQQPCHHGGWSWRCSTPGGSTPLVMATQRHIFQVLGGSTIWRRPCMGSPRARRRASHPVSIWAVWWPWPQWWGHVRLLQTHAQPGCRRCDAFNSYSSTTCIVLTTSTFRTPSPGEVNPARCLYHQSTVRGAPIDHANIDPASSSVTRMRAPAWSPSYGSDSIYLTANSIVAPIDML